MKYFIQQFWEDLHSSYWFYPLLLAFVGFALGLGTGYIDLSYQEAWLHRIDWLYRVGPAGAREILSLVASTSITITSVSFSIGVLILSLASAQFGPHILLNFMKHNRTQIVLGVFIGTFIFCLLNLRLISSSIPSERFFPSLSLLLGILLAIINFIVLIYFINMIARAIQVNHILNNINKELNNTIIKGFPKFNEKNHQCCANASLPVNFTEKAEDITAPKSGYIQIIDYKEIFNLAIRYEFVIHIIKRPGHFIIENHPIFQIVSPQPLSKSIINKLLRCLKIDSKRSTRQDIEFAFEEFVEIALHALSKSVNDPYTAMNCLDKMSISLALLANNRTPSTHHKDSNNQLRMVINTFSCRSIVNACFDRFRQEARYDLSVSLKMLDVIYALSEMQLSEEYRDALLRQVELIYQGCQLQTHLDGDLFHLTQRYTKTQNKLLQAILLKSPSRK